HADYYCTLSIFFPVYFITRFASLFFFLVLRPPPTSTLFPYTTLFRSGCAGSTGAPGSALCLPGQGNPTRSASRAQPALPGDDELDRKSTRLNSSHQIISYAVFCLKKKNKKHQNHDKKVQYKTNK